MMKRTIIFILCCLTAFQSLRAQSVESEGEPLVMDGYTDEYLDTVKVRNVFLLNDYLMVGVEYGASYARQLFQPKYTQESMLLPGYFGITLTKYSKMFGYLPYFGLQVGLMKGKEGYRFVPNKETGYKHNLEGTEQLVMDVIEVPMLAQLHYDLEHLKFMLTAGIYGGYRASVERTGPAVPEDIAHSFRDFDNRFDYGLQGGVGIGFVMSPVEFHINGRLRWSWESLYKPDYTGDPVVYNYAYPFDMIVTAGIHVHLTKRTGRTRPSLKQEAKRIVFETEQ